MKQIIKKLNEVSDNHDVAMEARLEKFCDFIIDFFSIDGYKGNEWNPPVNIGENIDYIELIALWASKVADEMDRGNACDVMGELYEAMYQTKSKASQIGQFFTPMSLCDLMAKLPQKEEPEGVKTVNDCACGSGRTLLAQFMDVTKKDHTKAKEYYYEAADIDLPTCKMCACNMMIHGMQGKVICQDQLTLPTPTAIFYINEVRYPFPTPYYSIRVVYPKKEEEKRKNCPKK